MHMHPHATWEDRHAIHSRLRRRERLAGRPRPACHCTEQRPDRAITAVVPFAAGAANDIVGRIVFEQVSKQVNQPIVFENRPGAGGTLGANLVAKSAPNGNTVLVHSSSFASALSLYKTLPYDTFNDFAAVLPLGNSPTVLVVAPSKGFKTVADLIAAAKAKPGAMNFASAGIGSTSHLAAERFR
jgi:tripartite-type tricarboxylate transporter receptor subunit TctC